MHLRAFKFLSKVVPNDLWILDIHALCELLLFTSYFGCDEGTTILQEMCTIIVINFNAFEYFFAKFCHDCMSFDLLVSIHFV